LIFCFRQELQPLECTQNRNIVVKCQTKYLYFYYNNYNNYNNFIIILFIILFFYLRICTYSTIVILKHVKSLKLTNISLPFEKKKKKTNHLVFGLSMQNWRIENRRHWTYMNEAVKKHGQKWLSALIRSRCRFHSMTSFSQFA